MGVDWRAYLGVGPGVLSFPAESALQGRATALRLLPRAAPSATQQTAKSRKPRQTWLFLRRRPTHDTAGDCVLIEGTGHNRLSGASQGRADVNMQNHKSWEANKTGEGQFDVPSRSAALLHGHGAPTGLGSLDGSWAGAVAPLCQPTRPADRPVDVCLPVQLSRCFDEDCRKVMQPRNICMPLFQSISEPYEYSASYWKCFFSRGYSFVKLQL